MIGSTIEIELRGICNMQLYLKVYHHTMFACSHDVTKNKLIDYVPT